MILIQFMSFVAESENSSLLSHLKPEFNASVLLW